MIITKVKAYIERATDIAVEECKKMSKAQLAELLHECNDKLVVTFGAERVAVTIVQMVALAAFNKEDE